MILTICVRVRSSRSRVSASIIMKSRASTSFDYSRQKEKEGKKELTSVYEGDNFYRVRDVYQIGYKIKIRRRYVRACLRWRLVSGINRSEHPRGRESVTHTRLCIYLLYKYIPLHVKKKKIIQKRNKLSLEYIKNIIRRDRRKHTRICHLRSLPPKHCSIVQS